VKRLVLACEGGIIEGYLRPEMAQLTKSKELAYMRDNYGSLRRRTRDSSWQWLLMGVILGTGFALVICVGGYALGVITFPVLEEKTSTPEVQVVPNQTEVAFQALVAQQTLEAAQQTLTPNSPLPTTAEQQETPSALTSITVQPTPLPDITETGPTRSQPLAPVTPGDGAGVQTANPTNTSQAVVLSQDTPLVGTPPVGEPTQVIGLPSGPTVPPELDAIKTELVPVTGGTYMMGTTLEEATNAMDECALYGKACTDLNYVSDSTPPHQATVDSFEMEVYEVTVQQYVTFLNWLGPNSHKTRCEGQPCAKTTQEEEYSYVQFDGTRYSVRNPDFYSSHPVTFVTWWGAEAYCQALNRRLPTEAEWERAARGRDNYTYPWGFEFDPLRAMSSISENKGTVPVDSYPNGASPYGVYNMAGNVSEWVYDWYQSDYYTQQLNNPQPNPQGPPTGSQKVLRGGSWDTIPLFLRSVHRMYAAPDSPTASIGFRCVADVTSPPPPVAPASGDAGGNTSSGESVPLGAPTLPPQPTGPPPSVPTATISPG
jgi:formylglycine-generating enzyme required for sulfatase activity